MNDYRIISDGSCDISLEEAEKLQVTIVPFYVSFDQVTYRKEAVEIDIRDFYQEMVDKTGQYPKSSLPAVQDYVDVFTDFAQRGIDMICICITSKFSGSVQSANNAREIVLEDYPDAKITVIDCRMNTVLQGLYVREAARLHKEGILYEECARRMTAICDSGRIFFTVGSIDYLQKGGRIGKLAGTAAAVLGIKPLITLKEGEIFSSGIARGRKRSKDKVLDLLAAYIKEKNIDPREWRFCIGFGYDKEESLEFRNQAVKEFRSLGLTEDDFPVYQIGATIAVHTGPYPLGLCALKKA